MRSKSWGSSQSQIRIQDERARIWKKNCNYESRDWTSSIIG